MLELLTIPLTLRPFVDTQANLVAFERSKEGFREYAESICGKLPDNYIPRLIIPAYFGGKPLKNNMVMVDKETDRLMDEYIREQMAFMTIGETRLIRIPNGRRPVWTCKIFLG